MRFQRVSQGRAGHPGHRANLGHPAVVEISAERAEAQLKEVVMSTPQTLEARVRSILREHGRLGVAVNELDVNSDLFQVGMSSHASVNVMLAIEAEFDLEFPDRMLKRSVFASIAAIRDAVAELLQVHAMG